MADPLTALMYAVQVMNFLKTLIVKTLRQREDSVVEPSKMQPEPSDDDLYPNESKPTTNAGESEIREEEEIEHVQSPPNRKGHLSEILRCGSSTRSILEGGSGRNEARIPRSSKSGQGRSTKKGSKKQSSQSEIYHDIIGEREKEVSVIRRVNSCTEQQREAWR